MKIEKITIENYKSIENISFDVKKYGDSFTTMFIGINAAGKTNILKAISYFNLPKDDFQYFDIHNQKDEENKEVNIVFELCFENEESFIDKFKNYFNNTSILDVAITNIKKIIYFNKSSTKFQIKYEYDLNIKKDLFFSKNIDGKCDLSIKKYGDLNTENREILDSITIKNKFSDEIIKIISEHEPSVNFWEPSDEYLISDVDLNVFKSNIDSNAPLKNIFYISEYDSNEKILEAIDSISNTSAKSRLQSKLTKKLTEYVHNKWEFHVDFVIEIDQTGKLTIEYKDSGDNNENDRFKLNSGSGGFRHFISLILSLSAETDSIKIKNRLILIDEPEKSLHPSSIKDLRDELINIGKDNILFVSTHSPFLIDRKTFSRNIIIKKDEFSKTYKKEILRGVDMFDDEVLLEAFGLNVYKDLLPQNFLLVEGKEDKEILKKVFELYEHKFGITNGCGSNIVQVASYFNERDVPVFVIVDDDKAGKEYKDKILKIGGVYNNKNVFTLHDMVPTVGTNCTIEDFLGVNFVKSSFIKFASLKQEDGFDLNANSPFLTQIKRYASEKKLDIDIDDFKLELSNKFNPAKSTFEKNFPLLKSLIEEITKNIKKLN